MTSNAMYLKTVQTARLKQTETVEVGDGVGVL